MQINLVGNIYKTNITEYKKPQKNIAITKTDVNFQHPIAFMGATVVQKTITSQIEHEKSKLLRQFKEILALNVPKLSPEEKIMAQIKRAHSIIKMAMRKEEEIEKEMDFLCETNMLNAQQKLDRAQKLKKEFARLGKIKLTEKVEEAQPAKDNHDYALINKFKTAVLNDNFDLQEVYKEHYKDMVNISTVAEFKERYPSIRIPSDPKDVIGDKVLETLNRKFYLALDDLFETKDEDAITFNLIQFLNKYFEGLAEQYEGKTNLDLLNLFGKEVTNKILQNYMHLKEFDDFESIPEVRKFSIARLSSADKQMLELDYNALIVTTLKKIYLEGEKLNQIKYTENGVTIDITSIKAPEYRFEKNPEKIKRLIADAQKPAKLQKDYQRFTTQELQSRLEHFYCTPLGNNNEIFNTIIDFASCKFTEEDRQYLIKFLQILDDIIENKISLEQGIKTINVNKIHPHGTIKLNEIERKAFEEKIKLEQQKNQALKDLREEFNNSINSLYELNLSDIAETFTKYYPENYEEATIENTLKAIQIIKSCTSIKDSTKIRSKILRWEIYNDYSSKQPDSEEFINASKYASLFNKPEKNDKIGQYLINREIIESYPTSKNMFPKTKILEIIMKKFGDNKDLATSYLCKYEDYLYLDKTNKQSIFKILELFDPKNSNDRVILKNIIEKDYINVNTTLEYLGNSTTIASKAKKQIYEKYKFPNCIDLFEAFENAATSSATEYGSSGIKKTGTNNNALDYKMELKIMGYPDRLFSSNNDYVFDVYSEKGLH